jgi:hypothetical protein
MWCLYRLAGREIHPCGPCGGGGTVAGTPEPAKNPAALPAEPESIYRRCFDSLHNILNIKDVFPASGLAYVLLSAEHSLLLVQSGKEWRWRSETKTWTWT